MGKVDRLRNRVEPFAVLYWHCSYTCQHLTLPAGPASLYKAWPYMVNWSMVIGHSWFNSQRRLVATPPFSHLGGYVIYLLVKLFLCQQGERWFAFVFFLFFLNFCITVSCEKCAQTLLLGKKFYSPSERLRWEKL